MIQALTTQSTRTARTVYRTGRRDGTGYTVTATPRGFYTGGVYFATLAAALAAARQRREAISCEKK